jgi:hypothetical protein
MNQAKPAAPLTDTDGDILLTTGHFSDLHGAIQHRYGFLPGSTDAVYRGRLIF